MPRAPALAASSNLSWVIPAAPADNKKASNKMTAGRATANSAVTAPPSLSPVAASVVTGTNKVMARTTPCEQG
ncbi:hypothetical protein StoSoilB5_40240 [Arthrobacter sp. StoSoilB5]|nr:hypothetical protein StoSoilB5_40240 [Arthrobacter sp. StoSoilB5]